MQKTIAPLLMTVLLAGCGQVGNLKPAAGKQMPPASAMATQAPTVESLLERAPEARPKREPLLPSVAEERSDDRFDLPPE